MSGMLTGLRVLELGGIGPVPHACMMLADHGAEVVRIVRPGTREATTHSLRGRIRWERDLKDPAVISSILEEMSGFDVVVEGFRPGVAERLGLGPADCSAVRPDLIYARMAGWDRHGPWRDRAGHDINFLAMSGVLDAIGTRDLPVPPLNIIADIAGGAMVLLSGILMALLDRERTGTGAVVDATMVHGAASAAQEVLELYPQLGRHPRGGNALDGGAPFYRAYRCADGGFMAVGALEPEFYRRLLEALGEPMDLAATQWDRSTWPDLHDRFESTFAGHDREHWTDIFATVDACVTPVLALDEAVTAPPAASAFLPMAPPEAAPVPRITRFAPAPGPERSR